MADPDFVAFTERSAADIALATRRTLNRHGRPTRQSAYPRGSSHAWTNGSGEAHTSCGCCDHTRCLTLPEPYDTLPFVAPAWRFDVPELFNCDCQTDPGGRVYVYRSGLKTWRSLPVRCLSPSTVFIPCTATATWTWTDGFVECSNNGLTNTYTCEYNGTGQGTWVLPEDHNPCPAGCDTYRTSGTPPDYHIIGGESYGTQCGPCEAFGTCGGHYTHVGDGATVTVPAVCFKMGGWTLTSVSDSDCEGTPTEPDFDGTTEGQTATTTFTGLRPAEGDEVYVDSFWELTQGEPNEYGLNSSRLIFKIGSNTILTYILDWGLTFCPTCERTWKLITCGPFEECQNIPQTVCVSPTFGEDCTTCQTSRAWRVNVSSAMWPEISSQYYMFLYPYPQGNGSQSSEPCLSINEPRGTQLCHWRGWISFTPADPPNLPTCLVVVDLWFVQTVNRGKLWYMTSQFSPWNDTCNNMPWGTGGVNQAVQSCENATLLVMWSQCEDLGSVITTLNALEIEEPE